MFSNNSRVVFLALATINTMFDSLVKIKASVRPPTGGASKMIKSYFSFNISVILSNFLDSSNIVGLGGVDPVGIISNPFILVLWI